MVYCNQILPVHTPLFLHCHANFEGEISNNEVCALIFPAIGLTYRRTSFELLRTSES